MQIYTTHKMFENFHSEELNQIKNKLRNKRTLNILRKSESQNQIDFITSSHNQIDIRRRKEKNLNTCLKGHQGLVTHLLPVTNDLLASSSQDNTIKLWKISKNECLRTLIGHSSPISSLIKLDDDHIASSCSQSIIIWNIQTGQVLKRNFDETISLLLHFDENKIIVYFQNTCGLFDSTTLECIKWFKVAENINFMIKINEVSISTASLNALNLYNIESEEMKLLREHNEEIVDLKDVKNQFISCTSREIFFWDKICSFV